MQFKLTALVVTMPKEKWSALYNEAKSRKQFLLYKGIARVRDLSPLLKILKDETANHICQFTIERDDCLLSRVHKIEKDNFWINLKKISRASSLLKTKS